MKKFTAEHAKPLAESRLSEAETAEKKIIKIHLCVLCVLCVLCGKK